MTLRPPRYRPSTLATVAIALGLRLAVDVERRRVPGSNCHRHARPGAYLNNFCAKW